MTSSIINYQLPEAPAARAKVALRCEITPGAVSDVEVPAEMLERWVAVKMVPIPGKPGVYRAHVRMNAPLMQVTDDLGDRMGWGLERRQILSLCIAGFADGYRCTSGATLIDPVSVWEHIYSTRLSTNEHGRSLAQEFWTPEHVRHYADAQEFVRASGIIPQSRRDKAGEIPHLEFDFGSDEGTAELHSAPMQPANPTSAAA